MITRDVGWRHAISTGLGTYVFGVLLVLAGSAFGWQFVKDEGFGTRPDSFLDALCNWDGKHYSQIAQEGYLGGDTHNGLPIRFAFFPAYPVTAGTLATWTTLDVRVALLLVSQVCLAVTCVILTRYAAERFPELGAGYPSQVVLAGVLLPTTFFMRMGYSESMFALTVMVMLWSVHRQWPLWIMALICGWATATRPVGVGLLLPFVWVAWTRLPSGSFRWLMIPVLSLIGCWGLIAYMTYQAIQVDDPLAFARVQEHWAMFRPESWSEKIMTWVTLEPIWRGFGTESHRGWVVSDHTMPLFSLQLANPVIVVMTIATLLYGAIRGGLNRTELLVAGSLFLATYLGKSYENGMHSFGRFMTVLMPTYLIYGRLLFRLGSPWREAVIGLASFQTAAYAALFVAGWWMI